MSSSEVRKPNYRRRFFWLAVVIVILFGGYSIAWFYAARLVQDFAVAQIGQLNQDGKSAECANASAKGFPLAMGLFCDSVSFADPATQLTLKTGAFQAGVQVYNPNHIAAKLDGPATISTEGADELGFDWSNLRADLGLATDFPDHVSIETDKFAAQTRGDSATVSLVSFGHGEVHMRRNGEDLDLAASFADTAVDPRLTPGTQLPPFAADADLSIKDGVAWARAGASSLRGQSGTIRTLALSLDPSTGLSLTGSFSVADNCLLSADLKLLVRNPKALAEQLAKAMPASANQVRMVFSAMSEGMAWPLKISGGKAMFGAINIPPLCDPTAS